MSKPINIICDECKTEFGSLAIEPLESTISNLEGITLRFFTCPKCNKIYVITLINSDTKGLIEDLEKVKKRIRKNYGRMNEQMAQMLNDMVIKKHNRLKLSIDRLMAKYGGTFTFAASENNSKEVVIKYLP